jgi:RND family efflux transporter MFP subunit
MSDHIHTSHSALPDRSGRRAVMVIGLVVLGVGALIALKIATAMQGRGQQQKQQAVVVDQLKQAASRPPTVEVTRGAAVEWAPAVPFEGTLLAQQEADLGFKAPGRLALIKARVGDKVRAGQLLATLSVDEARAQLAAAQAQLSAVEAQSALAADAAKRTAMVVASGAQSEAAGVQAEKQKQLAAAQAEAARAQVALARTALANHTLNASFAGTITRAPSAPGSVVAPGVPLFHVADLATLKLVGSISADDARLVKVDTPVEVLDHDGRTVVGRGRVNAVVPALDPSTKRVPVEAMIANDGSEPLLAGTLVRATLRGAKPITVLAFPHTVLRPGSQNEVLVVTNGTLAVRRIDHVVAPDGRLLVRKGVTPSDDVVLRPWPEAQDGLAVTVASTTTASKPAETRP